MATGVLVVTTTYHCHSPLQHPVNMTSHIGNDLIYHCHSPLQYPVHMASHNYWQWLHSLLSFTSATPSKHGHSHINFTYHCHSPPQHPANMPSHIHFTYHCHSLLQHPANMATVISTSLITVIHLCNTQQTCLQSYQLHLSLSFTSATPSKHGQSYWQLLHLSLSFTSATLCEHGHSHIGSNFTCDCHPPLQLPVICKHGHGTVGNAFT